MSIAETLPPRGQLAHRRSPGASVVVFAAAALFPQPLACRSDRQAGAAPAPLAARGLDRAVAAYPEMRAGRYAVIANFEDPHHKELFKPAGPAPQGGGEFSTTRIEASSRGGRVETGPGCIVVTLASESDAVVISDEGASGWALKRNWGDYDVLLLAVHSSRADVNLCITVRSGLANAAVGGNASRTAQTQERLARGWNLLRLDLAELGEHVSVDDVREVQLSTNSPRWPVELRVDGLILTADRKVLHGDPEARDGRMFVCQRGRRYHVGAGGKFELVFGNGQLVAWYDLVGDSRRARNLWEGVSLGFAPRDGAKGAHAAVSVASRLLEANAVRSVLAMELRPATARGADGTGLIGRWTYTVYASGAVFASVDIGPAFGAFFAEPASLAFARATGRRGGLRVFPTTPGGDRAQARQYAAYTPEGAAFDFGIAVGIPGDGARQVVGDATVAEDRVTFASLSSASTERQRALAVQLARRARVDATASLDVVDLFGGYPGSLSLTARAGKPVSEPVPFDLGGGAYRVDAGGESIRLEPEVNSAPLRDPAFLVQGTRGDPCWVYTNNKLVENTAWSGESALLFQIPGEVSRGMVIDVLCGRNQGAASR